MLKLCFKCKTSKPKSSFYKHPMMSDGRLGKCIECCKAYSKSAFHKNKLNKTWIAKERSRCRIKQEKYRQLGVAVKTSKESRKKWCGKNKHKTSAQSIASRAKKSGLIKKPKACEICHLKTKDLEMHHENYLKPLAITWVCTKCHGKTRWK